MGSSRLLRVLNGPASFLAVSHRLPMTARNTEQPAIALAMCAPEIFSAGSGAGTYTKLGDDFSRSILEYHVQKLAGTRHMKPVASTLAARMIAALSIGLSV